MLVNYPATSLRSDHGVFSIIFDKIKRSTEYYIQCFFFVCEELISQEGFRGKLTGV